MARKETFDHQRHYEERLANLWRKSPFVLRITSWKEVQGPVLVVKELREFAERTNGKQAYLDLPELEKRKHLVERGHLSDESLRRSLPFLRRIVERVADKEGIPLELQRYLTQEGLKMQITLPLDEEAGAKLSLLFRLHERILEMDRVELIARRVARFTREEAVYWLSRITTFGADANRWAVSGLRIVLGGQPKDPGVERMLERLRRG